MRHAARILVAIVLAASMAPTTAIAQPRQSSLPLPGGTSAIRGTLTDELTKAPIANCTVRAALLPTTPTSMRNAIVTTGTDGVYAFEGIADGTYSLLVECPSYLVSYLTGCLPTDDSTRRPCAQFTILKDQHRANVDFRMEPAATVRGRVVDSAGQPVPRAAIRIGGPFVGNQLIRVQNSITSDDGSYELGGLPTGSWALEVDIPPAPGALRSPLVYYPGVLKRDQAGLVEVIGGKVKDDVIITVPPVLDRTLTVRIPPPDATMTDVNVSVIRAEPLMSRRLTLDAEGKAEIKGLIDGRYVVMATAVSGQQRWVDFLAFDFLEESLDVPLQLQPAGRIRGRVLAERGGVPPLDGARIGAAWVDNDVTINPLSLDEASIAMDGSFEIEGIYGRRKLQLVQFDPGWTIHSVLQGRSDVAASGVDVTPGGVTEVTIVVRPR